MPSDEDKYPPESERRQFVKGVVGASTLGTVAATGAVTVNSMTSAPGGGGGSTTFRAVENTAGPAPRGMPQIPVEIDDQGYLKGVWPEVTTETVKGREVTLAESPDYEGSGVTYSSQWFQYCGVESLPGIAPDADQENYFRYTSGSKFDWQNEAVEGGAKVHVDDFADYQDWGNGIGRAGVGKPASVTWRSQDVEPQETIPVEVIRSTLVEEKANENDWLGASTEKGFLAHLNKCTHFCCVPSFKGTADSAKFGASNEIYCQCHQSVYDPMSIVERTFVARPRPED